MSEGTSQAKTRRQTGRARQQKDIINQGSRVLPEKGSLSKDLKAGKEPARQVSELKELQMQGPGAKRGCSA